MSFFENAPITFAVSLATLLTSSFSGSGDSGLDFRYIQRGEISRIFSSHFAFKNSMELIVGLILLYSSRLFERQMGSRKFGAFVIFSWILSLIIQLILISMLSGLNFVPSPGPYFLVFAQLAFFYRYIPKLYLTQYVFMGIQVSEKSGIYLLALQLFFNAGFQSIIPALIGLLTGYLYSRDFLRVQKYRLPAFFERFFRLVSAIISSLLPSTQQQPRQPGRAGTGGYQNNNNNFNNNNFNNNNNNNNNNHDFFGNYQQQGLQAEPQFELPPPDEESIQTLMNLGFEREAVVLALRTSGNNVDAAANRLLR